MRKLLIACSALALLVTGIGLQAMNKAYVSNYGAAPNTVCVIDIDTETVLRTVDDTAFPFGAINVMAMSPDGSVVYAVNGMPTNSISIIDTASDTVIDEIIDPSFSDPTDIACTPNGLKVYVVNTNDTVSVIDTATQAVTLVDDTVEPFDGCVRVAIAPNGLRAYVSNTDSDTVNVIDVATDTVVATIPGFDGPRPLAITPNGALLYVGNIGNNTLNYVTIDTGALGAVTNPPPTFSDPQNFAITADGNALYVNKWNGGNNVLSVVDIAGQIVTDNFLYGNFSQIQNIAFAPDGVMLYGLQPGQPPQAPPSLRLFNVETQEFSAIAAPTLTRPWTIAMPGGLQPPTNLTGNKTRDVFLTQIDNINLLSWKAPTGGVAPASYQIYRGSVAPENLAGTVPGTTLQYADHNRVPGQSYTYYVVSANQFGILSQPAIVTVA